MKSLLLRNFLLLAAASAGVAHAEELSFAIDQERSSVTASGYAASPSYRIQQQGPGSLTTKVAGTINVDLASGSIAFRNTSTLDALVNGNWQPGLGGQPGSAPADFAGQALVVISSVKAAFRDIELNLSSATLPLATDNSFDVAQLKFSFPTNSPSHFDYDAGLFGQESKSLAGVEGTVGDSRGSVTQSGSVQTITIPVNGTFPFAIQAPNDSSLTLTGQIVATRTVQVPTRIDSISVVNGVVTVQFSSAPTAQLELQSSNDLRTWTTIQTGITTVSPGVYRYTANVDSPARFYRVVRR